MENKSRLFLSEYNFEFSKLKGEINFFFFKKGLKNEVLILISGKFFHLESFSLLNYEANLLIRLFIHIPPEIHLIFIFQRDFNTAGIKFSSFCWIWVGDPIKGFN